MNMRGDDVRRFRTLFLAVAALLLAAAAFGPRLYRNALPLTRQIAHQGGEWQAFTLPSGGTYHAVLHHIPEHCHSPGIGLVAEVESAPADSLFALATLLLTRLGSSAATDSDRYVTVTLQGDHGRPWPWSGGNVYTYVWHRGTSGSPWSFRAYAVPPGGKPSAADSFGPKASRLTGA